MNVAVKQSANRASSIHTTFKLNPIAAACAMAIFAAGSVHAQQTDAQKVEGVVVTGIRKGIEDAISVKRNSDSIVEAVSAEDIGKLPDISVAESVSRLPGVTVQRSAVTGRAQGVSIRGMSPDFNGGLMLGREQASTAANRGIEFDQYPSELVSGITIYKTPDASLMGQGLSSTIDIQTVRPLSFAKRTMGASYRHEYNGKAEDKPGFTTGDGDRFSLSYIDQFADRRIGLALGWVRADGKGGGRPNFNTWGGWVADVDYNGVKVKAPGGFTTDIETTDFKRDGVMGVLQFRPNRSFESVVDMFYSKGDFSLKKRGLEGPLGGLSAGANDVGGQLINATVVNGVATSGTFTNYKGVIRNHNEDFTDTLKSVGWNNKFKTDDNWTFGADLSYSKVKKDAVRFETTAGIPGNANNAADTISFTGFNGSNLDQVKYSTGLNYADPNLIKLTDVQGWAGANGVQDGYYAEPKNDDTIKSGRLSAKYEMTLGPISAIDYGVNYTDRTKLRTGREGALIIPGALDANGNVINRYAFANMPGATTGIGGLTGIPTLNWDPAGSLGSVYNLNPWTDGDILAKTWGVKEKVITSYIKGDLDGKFGSLPYRGNIGLQIVNTEQSGSGNNIDRSPGSCDGGTHQCRYTPFSLGTSYRDFLPSMNLNTDLGNDAILRFGLGRQLARANMEDMKATIDFGVDSSNGPPTLKGSGGNPFLKPFKATAVDLSLEKYFGNKGYVSAAGFYKNLSTYILKVPQTNFDFSQYLLPSSPLPASGSILGTFTQPINGEGGKIKGIELAVNVPFSLMTNALDGFGVLVNYSNTNSSLNLSTSGLNVANIGTSTIPLPGLSKQVTNLRAYYEKYGFQVAVASRYRSEFLGNISDFQDNNQLVFFKAERTYDLQAAYEIQTGSLKGLSFLAQGNNLTNTEQVQYDPASGNTTSRKKFGKQYLAGISYKF
jgi:iron complex outermembrane recepter protein